MLTRLRNDNGDLPSILLLLPIMLIFMELIIFTGRITGARADVNAAASEAARQASLAAGVDTVELRVVEIANQTLQNRGRRCTESTAVVSEDSSLFNGGVIAVEVVCTIDISELGFITKLAPIDDKLQIRGIGIEGIDPLRVFDGDSPVITP